MKTLITEKAKKRALSFQLINGTSYQSSSFEKEKN